MGQASIDDVIAALYGAAAARNEWRVPFDQMSEVFGLWGAQIVAVDKVHRSIVYSHGGGPAPAQAAFEYVREYHAVNPRLAPSLRMGIGEWMHDHEHFDEAYVARSPFYQDFQIPFGGRYLSGTKLFEDERTVVMFGAMRGCTRKPLDADEIHELDRVKRHLLDALRIQDHLRQCTSPTGIASQILEHVPLPVLLVDAERQVLYRNGAALRYLRNSDVLVDREGTLSCTQAADDASFVLKLHTLRLGAAERGPAPSRTFVTLRAPGGAPVLAFLHGVRPPQVLHAFGHRPVALVIVYDTATPRAIDPLIVREAFGMTPAEARVAVGLAQGNSPAEIAGSHHVSLHTVRFQIQVVLQKLEVGRQADVVRILSGIPAAVAERQGS